jgi:hypothetical protein
MITIMQETPNVPIVCLELIAALCTARAATYV